MLPIGDLQPVSPELRGLLAAITEQAHRLRSRGRHDRAETLIRRAAEKRVLPPHVRQGMHALADLFRAHPEGRASFDLLPEGAA
ncbi:hypothetical protein ACXIUS_01575 [Bosea thiooxidans]